MRLHRGRQEESLRTIKFPSIARLYALPVVRSATPPSVMTVVRLEIPEREPLSVLSSRGGKRKPVRLLAMSLSLLEYLNWHPSLLQLSRAYRGKLLFPVGENNKLR